jgi:hypothetical protein
MKNIIAILLLVASTGVSSAQTPQTLISITYKSLNTIRIEPFALEKAFIDRFPNAKFVLEADDSSKLKRIVIESECLTTNQVVIGSRKYNLFSAKVLGKLSVFSPDGTLLYSADFGPVIGKGSSATQAEIDALDLLKKNITQRIETGKSILDGLL